MKKPLTIALAAALTVSTVGLSAAPASAHGRDGAAAFAIIGAIAGLAAISAANQHHYYYCDDYYCGYPPPRYRAHYGYYYGRYSPHVAWCLDHYRTYNPATNTYFRRPGVPAVCYSPY
jgi:hypothetical protein